MHEKTSVSALTEEPPHTFLRQADPRELNDPTSTRPAGEGQCDEGEGKGARSEKIGYLPDVHVARHCRHRCRLPAMRRQPICSQRR